MGQCLNWVTILNNHTDKPYSIRPRKTRYSSFVRPKIIVYFLYLILLTLHFIFPLAYSYLQLLVINNTFIL